MVPLVSVLQELEEGLEASRVGVRGLATHRAALANEAAAVEAQAAAARRRIPELEADKKTAAAARVQPLVHILWTPKTDALLLLHILLTPKTDALLSIEA